MSSADRIPVYSLRSFSKQERESQQFQVEVFDAHRHFSVKYPHRHDFFEVLYLAKGTGFHVIDGNKYEIKPPCVFFMSPGQAHKIEFSHDIEGFIFIFTPEFYLIDYNNPNRLIEFPFFFTIRQDNPPLLLQNNADVLFIESLFKKGIAELERSEGFSIELLRSLLDLILHFCAASYATDESILSGKGHVIVKKFYQLVEENYAKNLSVAQYADLMALTPNHLTQTVTRLTGKTSSEIIKAKQILEIKRLLVHTGLSVSEIAVQLNFADQSYFAKFFKRETGLSPMQYRAKSLK
ncbi:AraC family transcriptional regulator [Maribellus sp. YY47]|uniref:AraC family transcriptional regulator n=1 Tax=Maribellus sp. YY47 TaxID=2929486 RepID=UPI0020019321|nr:AraC family transcriptional regulator [Maribellus sp. YY47]MCK3685468.1 AraC family transcriptional regulator [Maribellus sp. YY47]